MSSQCSNEISSQSPANISTLSTDLFQPRRYHHRGPVEQSKHVAVTPPPPPSSSGSEDIANLSVEEVAALTEGDARGWAYYLLLFGPTKRRVDLPDEIVVRILSHLNDSFDVSEPEKESIARLDASLVCKQWRRCFLPILTIPTLTVVTRQSRYNENESLWDAIPDPFPFRVLRLEVESMSERGALHLFRASQIGWLVIHCGTSKDDWQSDPWSMIGYLGGTCLKGLQALRLYAVTGSLRCHQETLEALPPLESLTRLFYNCTEASGELSTAEAMTEPRLLFPPMPQLQYLSLDAGNLRYEKEELLLTEVPAATSNVEHEIQLDYVLSAALHLAPVISDLALHNWECDSQHTFFGELKRLESLQLSWSWRWSYQRTYVILPVAYELLAALRVRLRTLHWKEISDNDYKEGVPNWHDFIIEALKTFECLQALEAIKFEGVEKLWGTGNCTGLAELCSSRGIRVFENDGEWPLYDSNI